MGTIYLANILSTILLYSKYIPFNVTIISRPFMIIIIFEYKSNMVVRIHSKYTFINILHPIIFFRIHKIHLYILIGLQLNWSHLQLMGHTLFFLDEN
jgi:hypothetical protein